MLNYQNTEIAKKHAKRVHDKFESARWVNDDMPGSKGSSLQRHTFENVHEAISAHFTLDIYYNGVLFKETVHDFWDYYGFFESANSVQESIDSMSETYDLTDDKKFDIRVSYSLERKLYVLKQGKMYEIDHDWYYNPDDAIAYFKERENCSDEFRYSETDYDISRVPNITKPEFIFSTLRDGLIFKDSFYLKLKEDLIASGFVHESE